MAVLSHPVFITRHNGLTIVEVCAQIGGHPPRLGVTASSPTCPTLTMESEMTLDLLETIAENMRRNSLSDYSYSVRLAMAQEALKAVSAHIRERASDPAVVAAAQRDIDADYGGLSATDIAKSFTAMLDKILEPLE